MGPKTRTLCSEVPGMLEVLLFPTDVERSFPIVTVVWNVGRQVVWTDSYLSLVFIFFVV